MSDPVYTISDRRFYRTAADRQAFFERITRETPPERPAFIHRLYFNSRKRPKEDEPQSLSGEHSYGR